MWWWLLKDDDYFMGNKMLMTSDGTYTNAVYGFLAIMFKILEDVHVTCCCC